MPRNPQNIEIVYQFICAYIEEHGFAPVLRDIGAGCNLSTPAVQLCLTWLERQGRIRRSAGTARSIVVIDLDESGKTTP
jgi:repressor LexA